MPLVCSATLAKLVPIAGCIVIVVAGVAARMRFENRGIDMRAVVRVKARSNDAISRRIVGAEPQSCN